MKQSLGRYAIIFGVGLTSLLIAAPVTYLADTYLSSFYFQTGRYFKKEYHPLYLLIAAYLWWAHRLSQSKSPKALLLLKIIASPGYLAILIFFILLIIGPF